MLAGPRRSGKSSIARAVFGRLPPHETIFLEPTAVPRLYMVGGNTSSRTTLGESGGLRISVLDAPGDWLLRWAPENIGRQHDSQSSYAFPFTGAQPLVLLPDLNEDDRGLPEAVDAIVAQLQGDVSGAALSRAVGAAVCAHDEAALQEALWSQCEAQGPGLAAALGGPVSARRIVLPESALASSLSSIVFVLDASDETFAEATAALRGVTALLRGLAQARWASWAQREVSILGDSLTEASFASALERAYSSACGAHPANPFALPALHVFVHKADGEALAGLAGAAGGGRGGGSGGRGAMSVDEARAELLRGVTGLVAHELADAGFASGLGGGGGGVGGLGARTGAALRAAAPKQGNAATDGAALPLPPLPLPLPLPLAFHVTSLFESDGLAGGSSSGGGGGVSGGGSSSDASGGSSSGVLEALSRVVQRVFPGPQLAPAVEALLDAVVQACGHGGPGGNNGMGNGAGGGGLEKLYVLDAPTRLLLATDSNPLSLPEGAFTPMLAVQQSPLPAQETTHNAFARPFPSFLPADCRLLRLRVRLPGRLERGRLHLRPAAGGAGSAGGGGARPVRVTAPRTVVPARRRPRHQLPGASDQRLVDLHAGVEPGHAGRGRGAGRERALVLPRLAAAAPARGPAPCGRYVDAWPRAG